jgi:hypothetical protein
MRNVPVITAKCDCKISTIPSIPSLTRVANTKSPSPRQRADGVNRRADSCNLASDYMRHRVRRSYREWEKIGASVQTL